MPSILVPRRYAGLPRQVGEPFARQRWDDPIRYKLNRAYGSEFEGISSFRTLQRRFATRTAVAADFGFPGGSAIEWKPSAMGASIYQALPPGDFEAVLEVSGLYAGIGCMFGLSVVDSTGAGIGFSPYDDGGAYNWNLSGWGYASTGASLGGGGTTITNAVGGHVFVCLRRTGSTIQGRVSGNGSTLSAFNAGNTLGVSPRYLGITRHYTKAAGVFVLHRLNVYPGPTFFPG